ncbi:maestro heat-like repeat-containing protein family member 1 [Nycticebus coucang]|nr:maestro heat-like repeat-containing protein family member 1 [Nycticebus coucang]
MNCIINGIRSKAHITLLLFYHHRPLASKSKVAERAMEAISHLFILLPLTKLERQVTWLIQWLSNLTSLDVRPFYICQCLCHVLEELYHRRQGDTLLRSQARNVAAILLEQMRDDDREPPAVSLQSHSLAQRAFYSLSQLSRDPVFQLLKEAVKSADERTAMSALEAFRVVVPGVPLTEELKTEVMDSILSVIEKDQRPVRVALLRFLEVLGHHRYLDLTQGGVVMDYVLSIIMADPSNEEDICCRSMCLKILQMVPLPELLSLICEPDHTSAFVVLSESATEVALRAQAQGKTPDISRIHHRTFELISPQGLLIHLVLCALKPYRGDRFGVSALRLLLTLNTAMHESVGPLWEKEIPEMLEMLYEHTERCLDQDAWEARLLQFSSQSLLAIEDVHWLEEFTLTILERTQDGRDEEEQKAFLYRLFGFTLRTSRNLKLVQKMLPAMLNTSQEEPEEREGIAKALAVVSLGHLAVVLDELEVYGTKLTDRDTSSILKLAKEYQPREWGLVCHTIYLSYGMMMSVAKDTLSCPVDTILALAVQHYQECIVKKDKTLKLEYLDALTQMTSILSTQPIPLSCKFPHKQDLVTSMAVSTTQEAGQRAGRREDGPQGKPQ